MTFALRDVHACILLLTRADAQCPQARLCAQVANGFAMMTAAAPVSMTGLGEAINDRLKRAVAPR